MNAENRYEFILSLLQIVVGALITLVCVYCGFVLFRQHVEGGAYFLGLVSGSPAAALTYQLGKAAGGKDKPAPPATQAELPAGINISATAQAGETPDASAVSVSASSASATSPPGSVSPTPDTAQNLPLAFAMPALVDKDGNKLP